MIKVLTTLQIPLAKISRHNLICNKCIAMKYLCVRKKGNGLADACRAAKTTAASLYCVKKKRKEEILSERALHCSESEDVLQS